MCTHVQITHFEIPIIEKLFLIYYLYYWFYNRQDDCGINKIVVKTIKTKVKRPNSLRPLKKF